jgi:hypothetical protein
MIDEERPATREESEGESPGDPAVAAAEVQASPNGIDHTAASSHDDEPTEELELGSTSAEASERADASDVAADIEEEQALDEPAEGALVEVSGVVVQETVVAPEPGLPEQAVEENAGLIATMPEVARPPRRYFHQPELPTWLPPEFEQQEQRAVSPPLGRSPGRLPAVVLAILMSAMFTMFVLIEPTPMWLALLSAIVAVIGTDGVLRSIRHEVFDVEEGPDTVPHLFLPALFALAIPLLIEENLRSYWVIPAALLAGFAFVLIVLAEVPAEAEEDDEFRGRARFVSVASTYFVAFALFSLTYVFNLGLREAIITIALVTVLLAVELLREGEIDPLETLLLACVVGVVVAEARWVLQFMPLDRYPAGLALLLTFYFVTGMVHAYMTRHISRTIAVEYSVVTAIGLALVIAARASGVA